MSKFLIYTTLGSLVWNTILVALGSYMGEKWHVIVTIFEEYSLIIAGLLLKTMYLIIPFIFVISLILYFEIRIKCFIFVVMCM